MSSGTSWCAPTGRSPRCCRSARSAAQASTTAGYGRVALNAAWRRWIHAARSVAMRSKRLGPYAPPKQRRASVKIPRRPSSSSHTNAWHQRSRSCRQTYLYALERSSA
eukprot:7383336-Prymnesium_polylepis.1